MNEQVSISRVVAHLREALTHCKEAVDQASYLRDNSTGNAKNMYRVISRRAEKAEIRLKAALERIDGPD